MATPQTDAQVVVVGAGPVGLLLAGELRRAGVTVVVVDRLATPMTESRASQITTLTAELLHERGVDVLLAEAGRELTSHFGGLLVDLSVVDSPWAGNWKVPQYRTEDVLAQRAERLGAVLLRGHELVGLDQLGDAVVAEVDGPAGRRRLRGRYLVGCDGSTSTVRRLAGFAVATKAATKELLRCDVTGLDVPDRRFARFERGFAVAATRAGVTRVMVHEFGRGAAARTGPPGFAEVVQRWANVTGEDIASGTAIWLDSFDNSHGLATSYRRGRVLLAGDAAHWHMPIGGQALNVGLQDAVNLGWKLAGAVHGWAPADLLDGYHAERHAAAARVLDSVAAQEILLLGGPEVEPVRAVLAEVLGLDAARAELARVVAGLDVEYAGGDHPLVGRRLPNVELRTGSGVVRTSDLLAGTDGVVLWVADPAPGDVPAAVLANGLRLRVVRAAPVPADAFGGAATVLVRPDGYVAWAGDSRAGLDAALRRWFGAPALPAGRSGDGRAAVAAAGPPGPTA